MKNENLWQIVWMLAKTDFKLRYESSFLGFIWVILKPLATFAVLNFVFSKIFTGGNLYSAGLLTGIMLWNFFSEGTMAGMISFATKSKVMKNIFIPRWVIIIASSLNSLFSFIMSLIVLIVFYIIYGVSPGLVYILAGVYYCLLIYIIIITFSFFTAPFYPKLRDLNQIWEVILIAGFYAAPIIYPMEIIPPHVQTFLYINPMTLIIIHVRSVLIYQHFLMPWHVLIFTIIVLTAFIVSFLVFRKTCRRVVEYL